MCQASPLVFEVQGPRYQMISNQHMVQQGTHVFPVLRPRLCVQAQGLVRIPASKFSQSQFARMESCDLIPGKQKLA